MDDDAKRDLCRRLKDKYVDKFGYNKKIVIDDCLTQFIDAHDSTPSAQAMKELDVVMKKRVMGKDVKYQSPAEASLNSKSQYSSQPNLSRNKSFANPSSRQAGGPAPKKKDDKAVQQKLPDVTGKITNLPAPKIKRKQVKTVDEPTLENSQKSVLDEDLLNSIIRGEASDPRNPKKKVNRWGLIDMYKSDQYQAELKNISGKKKEEAEKYKKLLDIQMNQISQIKQMDNIETKAGQLMMRGENYTNKPVDEKALLNEYDSLQKEMEKSNVINARGS